MKKAGLVAAAAVAVIAGIIAWSTVRFSFYSAPDPPVVVHPASVNYFLDSYEASREAFRSRALALTGACSGASLSSLSVPGRTDDPLAVDVLHLPAQGTKRRLLVLSSGVHGVEGFTGSAVQRMFMDEFLPAALADGTGVLIIHGVNPYGFKHLRRVTENNVDLNRNSDTDAGLFATRNAGYAPLMGLINPESKAATRSAGNVFFHLRVGARIARSSLRAVRQAIAQGQYEFPRGILYGGRDFEPQIRDLVPAIGKTMGAYPLVMNIDLHTGYGARGVLHLFPNPVDDAKVRAMMESVFAGGKIDWGDGEDFYTITGDFSGFLGRLATNAVYLPMTFEYGTLNSQTTLGSIKTLQITSLENQGVQHGYASLGDEERIKRDFRELFDPSSPAWRTKMMQDTRAVLKTALANFGSLPAPTAPPPGG